MEYPYVKKIFLKEYVALKLILSYNFCFSDMMEFHALHKHIVWKHLKNLLTFSDTGMYKIFKPGAEGIILYRNRQKYIWQWCIFSSRGLYLESYSFAKIFFPLSFWFSNILRSIDTFIWFFIRTFLRRHKAY